MRRNPLTSVQRPGLIHLQSFPSGMCSSVDLGSKLYARMSLIIDDTWRFVFVDAARCDGLCSGCSFGSEASRSAALFQVLSMTADSGLRWA